MIGKQGRGHDKGAPGTGDAKKKELPIPHDRSLDLHLREGAAIENMQVRY